ncbi:hypothetical protein O3P69_006737 [Scylla paramamosain]|uniref:Uncharacterized protein n=1 Tax=Scylla paramamosain TaxID=85552 RepID=A0AAW0U5E6_SCYPA
MLARAIYTDPGRGILTSAAGQRWGEEAERGCGSLLPPPPDSIEGRDHDIKKLMKFAVHRPASQFTSSQRCQPRVNDVNIGNTVLITCLLTVKSLQGEARLRSRIQRHSLTRK